MDPIDSIVASAFVSNAAEPTALSLLSSEPPICISPAEKINAWSVLRISFAPISRRLSAAMSGAASGCPELLKRCVPMATSRPVMLPVAKLSISVARTTTCSASNRPTFSSLPSRVSVSLVCPAIEPALRTPSPCDEPTSQIFPAYMPPSAATSSAKTGSGLGVSFCVSPVAVRARLMLRWFAQSPALICMACDNSVTESTRRPSIPWPSMRSPPVPEVKPLSSEP